MSALPYDYDSDPGRFLSTEDHPHDDVHPYVAARFAATGARTVLDVGGGNGKLARLLPGPSMRCLLIDLSPAMLDLAPRPAVRADGARLPAADASVDAVAALFTLYHYADPLVPIGEARRVLRPGGLPSRHARRAGTATRNWPRSSPAGAPPPPSTARTPKPSWPPFSTLRVTRSSQTAGTVPWSPSRRSRIPSHACGCTGSAR